MKRTILIFALTAFCTALGAAPVTVSQADKDRAAALVSQMTLDEKIDMVSGKVDLFCTLAIPRLGIPSVRMADGPQGVRNIGRTHIQSTFYPCGMSAAATWNRDAVREMGAGIGSAAKAHGIQIMLGPGVNIYRSALCGRNFEYYGEDPYLTSETALSYITGMQDEGVMATIKHFALNNQEFNRHGVSSNADERTINEIYFASFRKAVEKGHVGAVMTSYNPINYVHAAENSWLVKDNLRAWGFEGIVMTDWVSAYNTVNFMTGGVDFEMPQAYVMEKDKIHELLENGVVSEKDLDEKCQHILQTLSAFGFLDKDLAPDPAAEDGEVSRRRAYEIALEGPVLLKNEDGILPLRPGKKDNIVVIGPNANIIVCGGGSGNVIPEDGKGITLVDGLQSLGKNWNVTVLGEPKPDVLRNAKAVIVAIGFNRATESEGRDRNYSLSNEQNDLVEKVASYNGNIIIVANSGGEFDMPWADKAKAILLNWYPGQEGGNALAALLSGKVSPSGRLPFTFWGALDKNPAQKYYAAAPLHPYGSRHKLPVVNYSEGIFIGYRGIRHFGVEPLYPFGYGLTYSTFEYSDAKAVPSGDGFDVTFTVRNSGRAEAKEVAQVYVSPVEPSVLRPDRELKGYDKKMIAPGASETYSIHLDADAFRYYDIETHAWKTDPGRYRILIGASSLDIRLEVPVTVQ